MSVACVFKFQYQRKIRYARKTKRHYIIFWIIESFPLLVGFSPLKYFTLWKIHSIIRWPPRNLTGPRPRPPPPPRNRYVTRIFPVVPAHSLPNQLYGYPSLPIRFHAAERNICLKNIGQKLKPSYVAISTILSLSCLLFTSFLFLLLCFVFIYLRLQHFRYAHAYWLIGSYAAAYNTASLVLQDYPWNA